MKLFYRYIATRTFLFSLLGTGLMLGGCKKFVQIPSPTTQLATASVFSNPAAATSAQLNIYIKMYNESSSMAQATGLLSDELFNYSKNASLLQYYTNSMLALQNPGPWVTGYNYIYQANSIIGNLQNNGNIPAPVAAQLTGESKFIRAYWHFYLTNLYGDVPLIVTTDYTINRLLPRTPQAQVYQQIIADLKDAAGYLNSNYVDASDTTQTTERIRPTKAAAAAMLARVYLYTKKYDSAEAEANLVINNGSLYSLCTNLSSSMGTNYVFQKNSTEAIWQLSPPLPTAIFTNETSTFILKALPGTGVSQSATISPQLLSSFEPNDKRQAKWIGTYPSTGTGAKYYYPYKYQAIPSGTVTSLANVPEYLMMLRLAEQYLIRAEARAQQQNLTGAIADLNAIRHRAGLPDYSGTVDLTSILTAILHERQVELFTEWGHRWLDLKRSGTLDAVMGGASGVCHAKGGTWASTDQWYPVPQNEILNNSNLKQNSGY